MGRGDQSLDAQRARCPGGIHLAVRFHLRMHQGKKPLPGKTPFGKRLREGSQAIRRQGSDFEKEREIETLPSMGEPHALDANPPQERKPFLHREEMTLDVSRARQGQLLGTADQPPQSFFGRIVFSAFHDVTSGEGTARRCLEPPAREVGL